VSGEAWVFEVDAKLREETAGVVLTPTPTRGRGWLISFDRGAL
jgi:hypothetical protein